MNTTVFLRQHSDNRVHPFYFVMLQTRASPARTSCGWTAVSELDLLKSREKGGEGLGAQPGSPEVSP